MMPMSPSRRSRLVERVIRVPVDVADFAVAQVDADAAAARAHVAGVLRVSVSRPATGFCRVMECMCPLWTKGACRIAERAPNSLTSRTVQVRPMQAVGY